MTNTKHLLSLLEPYNDAYSIELKEILKANIDKPLNRLSDKLESMNEAPKEKIHRLYQSIDIASYIHSLYYC